MINTTGLSDTIAAKIENEMQDIKDEMQDFKDTVFAAITGLKNQVEKSMTVTRSVMPPNQVATQQALQISETQELTETTTTATDTQQQSAASRTYSAFIVGDSVTRILSSNKLSDNELQVKIKSHSEGRLQDLHNSIIRMAETDDEFICANDVILIHGGTNNLSDGDSIESVTEQLERIAEIIEDVNPLCKIIISSVLPCKNDRLAN